MIPMRRRTSSAVIAATPPPRASGCCRCAATGTVSTASSRFKRYRIPGGLGDGDRKANAPDRGGPRPGALAGSLSVTACGVSAPARPAASPSGRRASAQPAARSWGAEPPAAVRRAAGGERRQVARGDGRGGGGGEGGGGAAAGWDERVS